MRYINAPINDCPTSTHIHSLQRGAYFLLQHPVQYPTLNNRSPLPAPTTVFCSTLIYTPQLNSTPPPSSSSPEPTFFLSKATTRGQGGKDRNKKQGKTKKKIKGIQPRKKTKEGKQGCQDRKRVDSKVPKERIGRRGPKEGIYRKTKPSK
jgi:hypothetical protein